MHTSRHTYPLLLCYGATQLITNFHARCNEIRFYEARAMLRSQNAAKSSSARPGAILLDTYTRLMDG